MGLWNHPADGDGEEIDETLVGNTALESIPVLLKRARAPLRSRGAARSLPHEASAAPTYDVSPAIADGAGE